MAEERHAYLISPSGDVTKVPVERAATLLGAGWVPANQAQADEYDTNERFSTGSQQLITGVEGAAQALTLGASTRIEKALGVPAEDIRRREEANPYAHMAGEAVGIVGPLLTGAGEVTAPGLISKAGQATERAVTRALPEATSALGRVGAKTVARAASGAVEGGLFTVGNVVHESALGDPNLTAQAAIEQVGLGTLFGMGLGGGLGLLGGVGGEALGSKFAARASNWLQDAEGNLAIRSTQAVPAEIRRLHRVFGEDYVRALGREGEDLGVLKPFSSPGRIAERAEEVMDRAAADQNAMIDEAVAKGTKPRQLGEIGERIQREVIAKLEESGTLARYLETWAKRFEGQELGLRDVWKLRQELDADLRGLKGVFDPTSSYVKDALHQARGILSDELETALGDAGGAWKQATRAYHVASTLEDLAEKGAARGQANNPISLLSHLSALTGFAAHGLGAGAISGLITEGLRRFGSGLGAAALKGFREFVDKEGAKTVAARTAEAIAAERQAGANTLAAKASATPERVAALSQLEKANEAMRKRLDVMVSRVVSGAQDVSHRAAGATVAHLSQLGRTPEEQIQRVTHLAQNPQMLQDNLVAHTDDLHEHAPDVAQAYQLTAARALGHLAMHAPRLPKAMPLGPKFKLNSAQKFEWKRRAGAVLRPTSILKHASRGTLTPLDVATVREVYPELHAAMVRAALEKVAQRQAPLPYTKRLMLSMLIGQDLDGTMSEQFRSVAQATFQMPSHKGPENQTGPGAARPSQTGLGRLKVANRAMLPGQAAAERERTA